MNPMNITRFNTLLRRQAQPKPKTPQQPLRLTRSFVETGDERCPIAGIWMALAPSDSAIDDPESTLPVMAKLLAWRALHPLPTNLCYSAA